MLRVMIGPAIGRSVKPLREKAERLIGQAATASEGHRLKAYHQMVMLAETLRPDRIPKTSKAELALAIKSMQCDGVQLPTEVCLALAENHISSFVGVTAAPKELLDTLRPWAPEDKKFDPFNPTVGSLPVALPQRVDLFKTWFWRKLVAAALSGDMDKNGKKLLAILRHLVESFEGEDFAELELASATILTESVACARALDAIISMPPDASAELALATLKARTGKTDRSITTCVASAVGANKTLSDNFGKLLKSMPVLKEFGSIIAGYSSELDIGDFAGASGFDRLLVICDGYGKVFSSSASDMFEAFGTKLLTKVLAVWAATTTSWKTGGSPICASTVRAAQAMFKVAATTWPLSDALVTAQASVGEYLDKCDWADKLQSLRTAAAAPFATTDFAKGDWQRYVDALQTALNECSGLDIDESSASKLSEAVMAILGKAEPHLSTSSGATTQVSQALDIGDLVRSILPRAGLPALKLARSLFNLVDGMVGAKTDPAHEAADAALALKLGEGRMHNLGVLIKQCDATMATTEFGDDDSVGKAFADRLADACREAKDMYMGFARTQSEGHRTQVETAKAACETAAPILKSTTPWHHGVTGDGNDGWCSLCAAADTHLTPIDTKSLEANLDVFRTALAEYKRTSGKMNDPNSTPDGINIPALEAWSINAFVLLHECLLVYHMRHEHDKAALRDRVQGEVRTIRKQKLREKEVLHPIVFARSLTVLKTVISGTT